MSGLTVMCVCMCVFLGIINTKAFSVVVVIIVVVVIVVM